MNRTLFRNRMAVLRQRLSGSSEADADMAWIIQPENRRYLSGFRAEDTQLTESSGSLLIGELRSVLVTDSRYALEAEREAADFEVKILKDELVEALPPLVQGLGGRRLGFEQDYVTWGLHALVAEGLEALSPPVSLAPLNGVVEEMREVKDAKEIETLQSSGALISAVLDEVIAGLKPGVTERDVAWRIEGLAREAGAEGMAFPPIVASGPNGALPHAVPTNRKLRKNEPIILDVGVRVNGYSSDMTRTVFLGRPSSRFKLIYGTVRLAQLSALKEVRPGVYSNDVDATARQIIKDAGFGDYFGHSLGHGVGLATHEQPRLGPKKPVKLKEGNVVTVEPGIYIPGEGGVRLEEMVVIEPAGPRILTENHHFYDFTS